MTRSIRRLFAPAIVAVSALGTLAHDASAQLALYNPQFPFAGAQAAPVNNQQGNTVQWLGADGGSMVLFPDGTTTFWAFGDTFLGPTGEQNRGVVAPLVVNTIAIGLPQNGQFNPYYYYRGNYTWNANYFPTNNPTPFFEDPLSQPTDPNQPTSRFWVGKAIFYNNKLFVFLLRIDNSGNPKATILARVNNPCDSNGHTTDPRYWSIDYLTLSDVPSPSFLAEAFYTSTDMVVYGVSGSPSQTFAVKIPLTTLYNAPYGSDISGSIQYLNTAQQWASSGTPGNPVGPMSLCYNINIPTTGGFTVRWNGGKSMWQTVYVNTSSTGDKTWAVIKQSPSPFGPWGPETQLFKFPEMNAGNPALNIPPDPLYNSAITCYSPYEIPVFESNPTNTVRITYSCTPLPAINNPYYGTGNAAAFAAYEDNYYRVKSTAIMPNPLP